jgi:hypothetical protein
MFTPRVGEELDDIARVCSCEREREMDRAKKAHLR